MAFEINIVNKTSMSTKDLAAKIHQSLVGCPAYVDNDILLHQPDETDLRQDTILLLLNGERPSSLEPKNPQVTFHIDVTNADVSFMDLNEVKERWANVKADHDRTETVKERQARLHYSVAAWLTEHCRHELGRSTPEGQLYDGYIANISTKPDGTVPTRLEFSIACIDAFLNRDVLMCDTDVDIELFNTDLVNRVWERVFYDASSPDGLESTAVVRNGEKIDYDSMTVDERWAAFTHGMTDEEKAVWLDSEGKRKGFDYPITVEEDDQLKKKFHEIRIAKLVTANKTKEDK